MRTDDLVLVCRYIACLEQEGKEPPSLPDHQDTQGFVELYQQASLYFLSKLHEIRTLRLRGEKPVLTSRVESYLREFEYIFGRLENIPEDRFQEHAEPEEKWAGDWR